MSHLLDNEDALSDTETSADHSCSEALDEYPKAWETLADTHVCVKLGGNKSIFNMAWAIV